VVGGAATSDGRHGWGNCVPAIMAISGCDISRMMQSDGRVIDGDVFLEKAMVRLDELGDILTSVERRRITRAITAKLRPPDRGPANVGGSSMAGATAEMDQR
jgi:hypothetical protein